jgi:hypothetical protein
MIDKVRVLVSAIGMATLFISSASAAPIQWSSGVGGNDHWYEAVAVGQSITWDDAKAAAETRGGYLATILSFAENAFVFDLVDSATYWQFESGNAGANLGPWLGGFQPAGSPEPGGGWTWLNGDGAFAFTAWLGGEPNNGSGSPHGKVEDHLHYFNYGVRSANWNDYPTSGGPAGVAPIAFVVEYDRRPVPEPATVLLLGAGVATLGLRRRRG